MRDFDWSEWRCPTCNKPHSRFNIDPALMTIIIIEAVGLLILSAFLWVKP